MLVLNCVICSQKKSTLIKNQELHKTIVLIKFKTNKIVNTLIGDNSACYSFTKHCRRIEKFRETSNLKHLYGNELDKVCFTHDAAYFLSNDLL